MVAARVPQRTKKKACVKVAWILLKQDKQKERSPKLSELFQTLPLPEYRKMDVPFVVMKKVTSGDEFLRV